MSGHSRQRRTHSPGTAAVATNDREDEVRLTDFLKEFEGLDSSQLKNFYHSFCNSHDMQNIIYRLLVRDRSKYLNDSEVTTNREEKDVELLKGLCNLLLTYYRSVSGAKTTSKSSFILASTANDLAQGRVVVLQYLPHLISLHLTLVKHKSAFRFIDAFLIAMYNLEAVEQQNLAASQAASGGASTIPASSLHRPQSLRVPSLSSSSIYHDSSRLESEDKLDQRPSGLTMNLEVFGVIEKITASNRGKVLQLLMHTFNRFIADIPKVGLDFFTRSTLKLLERGYTSTGRCSLMTRIHLDPPVLLELLTSAYVCMYSGFQVTGNQIVELIHVRASLSGNPQLLLVSNAIKNLVLTSGPSQVAVAHVSTPVQLAKNMITNASFRAKKMQTDIPKVTVDGVEQQDGPGGGGGLQDGNHGQSVVVIQGGGVSRQTPNLTSMASIIEDREDSSLLAAEDGGGGGIIKTPTKDGVHPGGAGGGGGPGAKGSKLIAKLRKKTLSISEEAAVVISTATENVSLKPRPSFERKDKTREKEEKKDKKKSSKSAASSGASACVNFNSDHGVNITVSTASSAGPPTATPLTPAASSSTQAQPQPPSVVQIQQQQQSPNINGDTASAASGASNNSRDLDTLEKVEELIQMKKLPTETIAIHSPESGTTIF